MIKTKREGERAAARARERERESRIKRARERETSRGALALACCWVAFGGRRCFHFDIEFTLLVRGKARQNLT